MAIVSRVSMTLPTIDEGEELRKSPENNLSDSMSIFAPTSITNIDTTEQRRNDGSPGSRGRQRYASLSSCDPNIGFRVFISFQLGRIITWYDSGVTSRCAGNGSAEPKAKVIVHRTTIDGQATTHPLDGFWDVMEMLEDSARVAREKTRRRFPTRIPKPQHKPGRARLYCDHRQMWEQWGTSLCQRKGKFALAKHQRKAIPRREVIYATDDEGEEMETKERELMESQNNVLIDIEGGIDAWAELLKAIEEFESHQVS